MDRDEMCNLYRGPPIDASYQVSGNLAKGFQRRRLECEKLTDDGCQVIAKAHIAFGGTTVLSKHTLRNDDHNLSDNTYLQNKIYCEFYNILVYIIIVNNWMAY